MGAGESKRSMVKQLLSPEERRGYWPDTQELSPGQQGTHLTVGREREVGTLQLIIVGRVGNIREDESIAISNHQNCNGEISIN